MKFLTSEEILFAKIKILPANPKEEVSHFVEFLETKIKPSAKRRSLKSALAHLNIEISDEDIREARNEMWRGCTKDTENKN